MVALIKEGTLLQLTPACHEQDHNRFQDRGQIVVMAVKVEVPMAAVPTIMLDTERVDHGEGHPPGPLVTAATNSTEAAHMGLQGNPM